MVMKNRSPITTHILDLAKGQAAAEVPVTLEKQDPGGGWQGLAKAKTNRDGRVEDLLTPGSEVATGLYRLTFDLESYQEKGSFYPQATICFRVESAAQHYHIPLLLSPFGYSTYRGT